MPFRLVVKGLSEAKGYITDGEEELDHAWRTELTKATHLRCIRHFKGNCKQKLHKIGISDAKSQKWFLEKVFGVPGKVIAIVDLEDKKEVKKEIVRLKEEMDKKESELLQKTQYKPQFSTYLYERRDLIAKKMSQKARRKAGMPVGIDGKLLRPYTNASEATNNVMRIAKENFLRDQHMPADAQLSKLQFTRHVFEELHHQQQELKLAVIGLSDQYQLSKLSAHLAVPPEVWFDWSENARKEYIRKFNLMSVDEALIKKSINVNTAEGVPDTEDFKELSVEVSKFLVQNLSYELEVARAVEDGALLLLNSPAGIQKQPTLDQCRVVKYEVASKSAKHKRVECTVNKNHISCRCPSFKADRVCKHSIAVAEKCEMLDEHLKFIGKTCGRKCSRTALAEAYVDKAVAGKKGSTNKNRYRPIAANEKSTTLTDDAAKSNSQTQTRLYSEIQHNDNPFVLRLLPKEAKICKGCGNNFCHRKRIVPNDLVLEHKERYFFPVDGDWKKSKLPTKRHHAFITPTQLVFCRDFRTLQKITSKSHRKLKTCSPIHTNHI